MADFSWINEQIAVSGAISDKDIIRLKDAGIDAIIDVRSEYCDNTELIEKSGMQFFRIEIDDRYSPTFEQLKIIFNFVEPLLDKGKKIFIHCQNGCGRAPLLAIAILAKRGMKIPDAAALVKDRHPWTGFSQPQEEFIYVELDKFLKSKY